MNTHDLDYNEDDSQEGSFLKRNWLALTVGVAVLAGGTTAAIALSSKGNNGPRKGQDYVVVEITPPPVMLPPPPPPPPMEEQMIQHEDEVKEETPPEDAGPSTNIVGNGPPDGFNLPPKGGARHIKVGGRSLASTWAPYAGQAANRIADAMRRHDKLKHSTMVITARIWIDATGRITRATTGSTGNAAVDAALRDQVLTGMQLSGPPPEGMQMPVVLKVTAQRPG